MEYSMANMNCGLNILVGVITNFVSRTHNGMSSPVMYLTVEPKMTKVASSAFPIHALLVVETDTAREVEGHSCQEDGVVN